MKKIFKYHIPVIEQHKIQMPFGAEILSVQQQHGDYQIWALVDPSAKTVTRTFQWYGTGHPIENADELQYIGTVQTNSGSLVFHLFEVL